MSPHTDDQFVAMPSMEQVRAARLNKTEPLIRHTVSRRVPVVAVKAGGSAKLNNAKRAKNDEFYTLYADVASEIVEYFKHDANVFRDKIVLLPCDDLATSNFTKFFIDKFDDFGLKRLISTTYKSGGRGKMFVFDRDTGGGCSLLEGDGDFRSAEVRALRDEADVIITNPPFSLLREFIDWIDDADKKFILIAPPSIITNKGMFSFIHEGKMWAGARPWAGGMDFIVPEDASQFDEIINGVKLRNIGAAVWFTNIDHGRRHEPLVLLTKAQNLRHSTKLKGKEAYDVYDNYNAIVVPTVACIPRDHAGAMGVPITFLDKYCPEQFEILGITESGDDVPSAVLRKPGHTNYRRPFVNGAEKFPCIFIRHKKKSLRGEL